MNLTRNVVALWFAALFPALFVPSTVAANIRFEARLEDPLTGILTLIAVNIAADLLLVTVAVFAALSRDREGLGNVPEDTNEFTLAVIVASVVVAVAGGMIDFVFLYERVENYYAVVDDLTAESIAYAMILIFGTVVASMRMFVGVRLPSCALAGATIAALNPLAWVLEIHVLDASSIACGVVWTIVTGVPAVLLLTKLRRYHSRVRSGEFDRAYDGGAP